MPGSTETSGLPIVETFPIGEHLPASQRITFQRNPVIDGIIDFTGGTMGGSFVMAVVAGGYNAVVDDSRSSFCHGLCQYCYSPYDTNYWRLYEQMGGIACVYVGQPLDTVKVKMQTFPTIYRNALHCFRQTYRQDGIRRGLYAGTVPALVANIAENSVLFMCYGYCQKAMAFIVGKHDASKLNPLQNALSGAFAAIFSSFTLCPTELVKCRLQAMREMASQGKLEGGMERLKKTGPYSLTKEILHEEGIRGLFKGLMPTFMREVPGYFFFFGGYEASRYFLTPVGKTKDDIGLMRTAISGGLGGVALWVAIFPADVVKSRIQVSCTAGTAEPAFFSTVIQIFKQEGILALYKGLGPTVLRTFPATGALFVAYEYTKKWLGFAADKVF